MPITPQPWILRRVAERRIVSFTYDCPGEPIPWQRSPPQLELASLVVCPLQSLSVRVVAEESVNDVASILVSSRESLRRLQLRLCWWEHPVGPSFNYPASIARMEPWERDELLPIFRLLNPQDRLRLSELKLSSIANFRLSNLARVIEFRTLETLSMIDTRVGDYGDDFWQCLTELEGHLALKSLVTDCESESLGEFLSSFKGLEDLALCHVDKRWHDISPSHPSLAHHFSTLKRLFLPRDVHGSSFMTPRHVSLLVNKCSHLEELGFAFYEEDMVCYFPAYLFLKDRRSSIGKTNINLRIRQKSVPPWTRARSYTLYI